MLLMMRVETPSDERVNVADHVRIGAEGLRLIDKHVRELVARHPGRQDFTHAAYVLDDGALVVAGWSPQAGSFAFRLEPGAWQWVRRPA